MVRLANVLLLLFLAENVRCESEWGFDNAPGIAMEYKVHIDPGKEDCYWQYVQPSGTIYVNMQVLKGGDGMAGMAIKDPTGKIVYPYQWKQSVEHEETSESGGHYAVCIDNQFSRFAGKLINLYITTFRYDLWEQYTKEIEELDVGVQNFTVSLKSVDQKIHNILQYQSYSRARESRDFRLLMDNNSYVFYWSVAQCVTIMLCSASQTYFLRRLFDATPTQSGRRA